MEVLLIIDKAKNKIYKLTKMNNPLNIYDGDSIENKFYQLRDHRKDFQHDLIIYFTHQIETYSNPTVEDQVVMIVNYAIDLMIEYRNKNLGRLPMTIFKDIIEQMKDVSNNLFTNISENPSVLIRIEKDINWRVYTSNIEDYIKQYFKYFLDLNNENEKKIVKIAKILIEILIDDIDSEGAYASQSFLIENVRKDFHFTSSVSDIRECINFINTVYGNYRSFYNKVV